MKSLNSRFVQSFALLFMLCASLSSVAKDERHAQQVKDLAYGISLFHFFQGKQLAAITRIEVAKHRNSLQHQPEDAELLLGGLYFEYGLANDAEDIFLKMLDEDIAAATRNRVWFNLARVQYDRHRFAQTEELLSRINGPLPAQHEAQKQHIRSNIYILDRQYDKSAEAARLINPDSIWLAYSQYNLGISLSATENEAQGRQWLNQLSDQQTDDEELLSLLDATRLALGLDALKQQQQEQAIEQLSKVRLSGPLSNKALLGTGWAWSAKSDPDKALTYWLALRDKQQTDAATQEALLAIAHAFEQKNNKLLATQFYEQAASRYSQMLVETDEVIDHILSDELLQALHNKQLVEDASRNVFERRPPQSVATPYLHRMFADKPFQLEIQRYQELLDIKTTLTEWQQKLPAFSLMLKERRKSFESKRPLVEQTTDFERLENLQQQRDEFAMEVDRIESSEDILALANEDEADYLEQLDLINSIIVKLENQRDLSEEQDKYRLLSGLMQWSIDIDFPRRMWRMKRELQMLDRALEQATASAMSLQQAAAIHEQKLDDFDQRIEGRDAEVYQLYEKVIDLISLQEKIINKLATEAMESRKLHITQLRLSARYSIARLYDEIASDQGTQQ